MISLSSLPLFVRHPGAMFKLVYLEAFPASGVWACLTDLILCCSKTQAQTKPHPAATYLNSGLETQLSTSSFLFPSVPPGAID